MISWQYLAGFFDGEGSLALFHYKDYGKFTASIPQSGARGERVLGEIKEFLLKHGIKSYLYMEKKPSNSSRQVCHRLQICHRGNVIPFLKAMMPYLHIKKTHAQDFIRYSILFPRRQGRCRSKMFTAAERRKLDAGYRRFINSHPNSATVFSLSDAGTMAPAFGREARNFSFTHGNG